MLRDHGWSKSEIELLYDAFKEILQDDFEGFDFDQLTWSPLQIEEFVDVLDDLVHHTSAADNIPIQHFNYSDVKKMFNAHLLKYRPTGWSHYDVEDQSVLTNLFDEGGNDKVGQSVSGVSLIFLLFPPNSLILQK